MVQREAREHTKAGPEAQAVPDDFRLASRKEPTMSCERSGDLQNIAKKLGLLESDNSPTTK
jgi:hypothetical protein